jgi:hypothetical protein
MPSVHDNRLLLRVYGDSLGMPRSLDGIHYTETYAELLTSALRAQGLQVDLYNRSKGNIALDELKTLAINDHRYFGNWPEIVVIQCGIVDCAPRPVSGRIRRLVGRLPAHLRSKAISFLHSNRARILNNGFRWRVTEPQEFQTAYVELLRSVSGYDGWIYAVGIAPTTPEMEQHSPGLTSSILLYNEIICTAARDAGNSVRFVDVNGAILEDADGLRRYMNLTDGHHITTEGHSLYARLILAAVQERQLKQHHSRLPITIADFVK